MLIRLPFIAVSTIKEITVSAYSAFGSTFEYLYDESDSDFNSDNSDSDL